MKMSKKLWALISLSLLFVTACGSASAPVPAPTEESKEVAPFVSTDGNFSVNFPGNPERSLETDSGLDKTMYSYVSADSIGYSVSFADVEVNDLSNDEIRGLLKEDKANVLEYLGAKVADQEKDVDYDGKYPGLSYKAIGSDKYVIVQNYVIESRLYEIMLFKRGSYPADVEVKNFVESFKILK